MRAAEHAVVIGGSIGGLCAARVLSDYFPRVTVIDRDTFPEGAQHRRGVPQSRHPHALLDGGRRELERWFPGFAHHLLAEGALELDPGLDMALLRDVDWAPRRATPHRLLFASRVLIESVVRRLAPVHGIEYLENTEVTGLRGNRKRGPVSRVTGVLLRDREGGATSTLEADLVVDASGRDTRAPDWLRALGFEPPPRTEVDVDAGYSTRWYQAPPPDERPRDLWWKSLWVEPVVAEQARPEEQYFGVLFPVEQDRWIVTTASWGGRALPKTPEEFEDRIARLRTPVLEDALRIAKPISPVYHRRGMQNRWQHYESWEASLGGFIATADAACGFNPVYGQGMTSAAFCAGVLDDCFGHEEPDSPAFAARFFRRQARFLQLPWMMATSRDLEQARVPSEHDDSETPSLLSRAGSFYLGQVAMAAGSDPGVGEALFDVINLTRRPSAFVLDPRLVARIGLARARQLLRPAPERNGHSAPHPPPPGAPADASA